MSEEHANGGKDLGSRTYPPPEEFAKNANIQDPEVCKKAAEDYESFWEGWAQELHWFKEWDQVLDWNPPFAQWFVGGKTNAAYNCLDVHVEDGRADKTALIWIGDEPDQQQTYTYSELLTEVSKFANVLKDFGIGKGDTVVIYLPMIPELPISMLACARIGAVHSVRGVVRIGTGIWLALRQYREAPQPSSSWHQRWSPQHRLAEYRSAGLLVAPLGLVMAILLITVLYRRSRSKAARNKGKPIPSVARVIELSATSEESFEAPSIRASSGRPAPCVTSRARGSRT